MEAHGGYLSRLEEFESSELIELACRALAEDGQRADSCSLAISRVPRRSVIRIAFDSPHTYGRRGARWYEEHHALARLLSRQFHTPIHAYVLDPEEFEQVVTYAAGGKVGGERLDYDEVDPPAAANDEEFEQLNSRWPLGYLARILGVSRNDLVKLPRAPCALLELEGAKPRGTVADLLPPPSW